MEDNFYARTLKAGSKKEIIYKKDITLQSQWHHEIEAIFKNSLIRHTEAQLGWFSEHMGGEGGSRDPVPLKPLTSVRKLTYISHSPAALVLLF